MSKICSDREQVMDEAVGSGAPGEVECLCFLEKQDDRQLLLLSLKLLKHFLVRFQDMHNTTRDFEAVFHRGIVV
jgi:hypothetical protein